MTGKGRGMHGEYDLGGKWQAGKYQMNPPILSPCYHMKDAYFKPSCFGLTKSILWTWSGQINLDHLYRKRWWLTLHPSAKFTIDGFTPGRWRWDRWVVLDYVPLMASHSSVNLDCRELIIWRIMSMIQRNQGQCVRDQFRTSVTNSSLVLIICSVKC
jgi:hypothetical protein